MPVRTSIRSRRAKSRPLRGSRIPRRRVRGGSPSAYDGMNIKELVAGLSRLRDEQKLVTAQIDAHIMAIDRIQSGSAGSSSTVSSAGEGGIDITNLHMFDIAHLLKINDRLCLKRKPPGQRDYLTQEFTMDKQAIDFVNEYKNELGSRCNISAFMQYLVSKRDMKDYISFIERL